MHKVIMRGVNDLQS